MKIESKNFNNQNFKSLYIDRNFRKEHQNLNVHQVMYHPEINKCAKKYEVLVKRKVISKLNNTKVKLVSAAIGAYVTCSSAIGASMILGDVHEFISLLSGGAVGSLCYGLMKLFDSKYSEKEYYLQAGKRIVKNKNGTAHLEGSVTKEYKLESKFDLDKIKDLNEEIENEDLRKVFEVLDKKENGNIYDAKTFLNILNDETLQKEFPNGEYFNIDIDGNNNTLLTAFFDIVPTGGNQAEYKHIITKMKKLSGINYNQTDSNGITVLEKVLNSENNQALSLLKNKKFEYQAVYDVIYNNITDEQFKQNVVEIVEMTFPLLDTEYYKKQNDTIVLMHQQLKSPFCKNKAYYEKKVLNRMDEEEEQQQHHRTNFGNNWLIIDRIDEQEAFL